MGDDSRQREEPLGSACTHRVSATVLSQLTDNRRWILITLCTPEASSPGVRENGATNKINYPPSASRGCSGHWYSTDDPFVFLSECLSGCKTWVDSHIRPHAQSGLVLLLHSKRLTRILLLPGSFILATFNLDKLVEAYCSFPQTTEQRKACASWQQQRGSPRLARALMTRTARRELESGMQTHKTNLS